MHCHRFISPPCSRREMLTRCANGFGAVALSALGASWQGPTATAAPGSEPRALPAGLHHPPRAKSVIFLFMDGGPSQVDTFDPKPRLEREHGQPIKMEIPLTQFNDVGNVLKSPWAFKQRGESGITVSDLFPHVAECVDELAVIRSMVAPFSIHTNANYFIHSGHGLQGRPSMGAWTTYGLGSENENLPGFVVLDSGMIPPGGLDCFNSGFLPATYQASVFRQGKQAVADLLPRESTPGLQARKAELLRQLDQQVLERYDHAGAVESAIANYELAYRMQAAVPDLMDISDESQATCTNYGLDHQFKPTQIFARQCLIARRLVERGVRFIEVLCPKVGGDRWDQHGKLKEGHENNARATDQPIAALLKDLKARGLLDETLVVWAGEFGRTPMAQGTDGRDHNPFGFTIWLAGGGIRGGTVYGATDEYGYYAIENKTEIHDLHATMFHLLGVDHERLTFRAGGRDMRLTDVHGNVIEAILA